MNKMFQGYQFIETICVCIEMAFIPYSACAIDDELRSFLFYSFYLRFRFVKNYVIYLNFRIKLDVVFETHLLLKQPLADAVL